MPIRTWLPTISITWTEMSSPSMIFSPGRRVMISIGPAYPPRAAAGTAGCRPRSGGDRLARGEQRRADGRVGRLVDDLAAGAAVQQDGRPQVGVEVLDAARRADGHEDAHAVAVLRQPGGRRGVVG